MPYIIGTDLEEGIAPGRRKKKAAAPKPSAWLTIQDAWASRGQRPRPAPTVSSMQPLLGGRPQPRMADEEDMLGRRNYLDSVYGGLVSPHPDALRAVGVQYDYNKKRVQAGKEPLSIADVAWNPQAHDDDTNEALALWFRDKGFLPDLNKQSEFDYMRQEYNRQKAGRERQAIQPEATDPQPEEAVPQPTKSRPVLDLQPVLYNLADRFAYTKNVYGGDEGFYWRNRDAIDAQYDYNDHRPTAKGVKPIADFSWNPNDHDDDTNEALGFWYRDHGKLPGLDHQAEFDYMNQEYSRQKAQVEAIKGIPSIYLANEDQRELDRQRKEQGLLPNVSPTAPASDEESVRDQVADAYSKEVTQTIYQLAGEGDYTTDEAVRRNIGAGYQIWQLNPATGEPLPEESVPQTTQQKLNMLFQIAGDYDLDSAAFPRDEVELMYMHHMRNAPTTDDVLQSTLDKDQLAYLADSYGQVLGVLTDQQKQQMMSGKGSILSIFDQLNPEQQEKINQLSQSLMNTLSPEQRVDLLFLNSGMLRDIDLQKRQAILNHLKGNDGAISYDDLVRIGVFQPGELAESGFSRWLQNLGGGPAHLHELLEEEYRLNNRDTSFANLDQEQRQRRSAEQTMLLAMIAAPAIDGMINGPSGVAFGDNVYDNIERYGTQENFKGSHFSWKPTEPGSLVESAGDLIDGIIITDGKVGGKIPTDEFKTIRQSSIKNPDTDSMTLGKFRDDATSYTQRAGTNSSYFDLGSEWGTIKEKYGLNNNEMFDYFNKPALNDAISKGKTIRFSHNPLDYGGSFLADEWEYLKGTLSLTDANLVYNGGFWYVR